MLQTASIFTLHGDMTWEEQKKCFNPTGKPRLIFATDVARTSITIPDLDVVISLGLRRVMHFAHGIESLTEIQSSKADLLQEQGRVGRTKPGKYILYSGIFYDGVLTYSDKYNMSDDRNGSGYPCGPLLRR